MKNSLFLSGLFALLFSSCGVNETFQAMESNRAAIDTSTCVIYENVEAIEQANRGIEENTRHIREINKSLKDVGT